MAVTFENFAYSYTNDKGKPVFVPTDRSRRVAVELIGLVKERVNFEDYYYHFSKGAHVGALHAHRVNRYFARLDLKNYFYSVSRNRVKAALKEIGVPRAEHFAKWSSVRNPYEGARYAIPYGFPQSPLLATLAMKHSALGQAITALPAAVLRSVYLDDIAISSNDRQAVTQAFENLKSAAEASNFTLNEEKIREPSEQIDLFNCDLTNKKAIVSRERVAAFYSNVVTARGAAAFEAYRASVADGNE